MINSTYSCHAEEALPVLLQISKSITEELGQSRLTNVRPLLERLMGQVSKIEELLRVDTHPVTRDAPAESSAADYELPEREDIDCGDVDVDRDENENESQNRTNDVPEPNRSEKSRKPMRLKTHIS